MAAILKVSLTALFATGPVGLRKKTYIYDPLHEKTNNFIGENKGADQLRS